MKIPLADLNLQYQSIKAEIDSVISAVIEESAFIGGRKNRFTNEFEKAFSDYLGIKHTVGCGNGTDSIEIILKSLGVGFGDEVIVPALSWISTSEAVSSIGAKPVFVDIEENSFCIDPKKMEEKITSKTKAIIPVHLYGHPANMERIVEIANANKLFTIEDCAQAHGAEWKFKKVSTFGNAGSFSFFPGKNLGAYGDAGGIVTNDDLLAEICRQIANHGQIEKNNHEREGRNSRLDGIQSAVLSVKLKYLHEWTDKRIDIAAKYNNNLSKSKFQLPACSKEAKHVYHLYVIRVDARDAWQKKLKEKGIETGIHYPIPLPLLKVYNEFQNLEKEFPVANKVCKEILSLPLYPEMTDSQIEYVINALNNIN